MLRFALGILFMFGLVGYIDQTDTIDPVVFILLFGFGMMLMVKGINEINGCHR